MKAYMSEALKASLSTADRADIRSVIIKLLTLSNSKTLSIEEKIIISKAYFSLKQITDIWKEQKNG